MPHAPSPPPDTLSRGRVSALSSKFNLPGTSSAFVPRQAITDRIERAASARVVLVRAPAGFGKTSAQLNASPTDRQIA